MRRAPARLLLVAVPLIAATAAGCVGTASPTVAPTQLIATSARSTPAPTVTATRTATATPTARPVAAVRPVRVPRRSAQEVSRVVYLPRRNEVQGIFERDAPRGSYEVRAACTGTTAGRHVSLELLDARPRTAEQMLQEVPMASLTVPCSGRVLSVGFSGFGDGGSVQLQLGDVSDLTSAYAVLAAAPR